MPVHCHLKHSCDIIHFNELSTLVMFLTSEERTEEEEVKKPCRIEVSLSYGNGVLPKLHHTLAYVLSATASPAPF